MDTILKWLRQPTTLVFVAALIAGVIYWFSGSAQLAAAGAAIVLGTISDNTAAILAKMEALEDLLRPGGSSVTVGAGSPIGSTTFGGGALSGGGGKAAQMLIRMVALPIAISLMVGSLVSACTTAQQNAGQAALVSAGVSQATAQTIASDAGYAGQLLCLGAQGWSAVKGANVLGASAPAVAGVCSAAAPGSVPGMPSTSTLATVVTVGADVLAQLNASKTATGTTTSTAPPQ